MKAPMWVGLSALLAGGSCTWAQQYVISTIAGGAPPPSGIPAVSADIGHPGHLATDAAGNLYFASSKDCLFQVDPTGVLIRVAGNARGGFSGDNGPATNAQLGDYRFGFTPGVAVDASGNLYISDTLNNRVRRVAPNGIITTIAGSGAVGTGGDDPNGDGGPAIGARLAAPAGVAVDSAGNVYIADSGSSRIRKVTPSGIITTIAGIGVPGYSGDGGPAASAQLSGPLGVAADATGNLYIADTQNGRIRRVASTGIITTMAGNGSPTHGYSGDGGPATTAELSFPSDVAVDGGGNLYIADNTNNRIRKVSSRGIITTIAGNGAYTYSGDGGPATGASLRGPLSVATDASGNLYIADTGNNRIRKISPAGIISTIGGNGAALNSTQGYSGDGGQATSAQLSFPQEMALDRAGNLYLADYGNHRIRKASANGIITTIAGTGTAGFSGDAGPATSAQLNFPTGVAVDDRGNVYLADGLNSRIRKVSQNGVITTVGGNGSPFSSGDGGPATSAGLLGPGGMTVDGAGSLYLAEAGGHRIRKIAPDGIITSIAGSGFAGYSGDGGLATSAQLRSPSTVALDAVGNLYIADSGNNCIRKVARDGIITTIAGGPLAFDPGDGGPATNARLIGPSGVAVDAGGNLYIAEQGVAGTVNRIRKVSPEGIIVTIGGSSAFLESGRGYSGDGGPATRALLNGPRRVALDAAGNVYVLDSGNDAVRLLEPDGPSPAITAITNNATNLQGPLSPGEIVIVNHSGIGPAQLTQFRLDEAGRVAGTLDRTQVLFDGTPAPILYTWTTQLAAVVPYSVTGPSTKVQLSFRGQTSAGVPVLLASSSPGLFTADSSGKGQAAAVNADGTYNSAANPAPAGSVILLYATGEGQTSPAGIDGKLGTLPLPRPLAEVTVTIGGQPAEVLYAGGAPDVVAGVMQINAKIPGGVSPGPNVSVVLQVGNTQSQNGVTVAVTGN